MNTQPLDLSRLKVLPLRERQSLSRAEHILVDPDAQPPKCTDRNQELIRHCAARIRAARERNAAVILIYGAHLLRNGAARIVRRLLERGEITHLATNGAGSIHDWEYAWCGASTESVEMGVAAGCFGTWHETASNIHLAVMAGALDGLGYGCSLARFIAEDSVELPSEAALLEALARQPDSPHTAARADLLAAMRQQGWPPGRYRMEHPWKEASIFAAAWQNNVPITVHPGIGYDIISNHPVFSGSALGRGGGIDFRLFGGAVDQLDGGVVLSIGSAIMGPQVFEKSISCVNNLRLQAGRQVVRDHAIYVVDLQDGGGWDWSQGEPPKNNPAYYLRFCKSFSRMGGHMAYAQCDNLAFLHCLLAELAS